jgi:hypothetical protein
VNQCVLAGRKGQGRLAFERELVQVVCNLPFADESSRGFDGRVNGLVMLHFSQFDASIATGLALASEPAVLAAIFVAEAWRLAPDVLKLTFNELELTVSTGSYIALVGKANAGSKRGSQNGVIGRAAKVFACAFNLNLKHGDWDK